MRTQYFSRFPGFLALAMGVMIGFVTPSNGQEPPISRSEGAPYQLDGTLVWSVPDPISGRDYSIFVSLPDSYNAKSDRRFPVLYVTDADYGFPLIRSIVRRINSDGPVTKDFIIVGLSYAVGDEPMESRRRDYTPVTRDDGKGGGGPAYQAYLNEAVFPFVEKNLRADPKERIFMGHSYGGLLGAQILLSQPTMFKSYILGSPSLWYGKRAIFRLEEQIAQTRRDMPANVFMYVGEFEAVKPNDPRYKSSVDMVGDNRKFERLLSSRRYEGLHIKSIVVREENHLTVFPEGFTRGIIHLSPVR